MLLLPRAIYGERRTIPSLIAVVFIDGFFARLATPLYPIMDNMFLESFFFFVPYRLVWDNWEKMHGAQDDPADSISFSVPAFADAVSPTSSNIYGYMGLPNGKTLTASTISTLPFRMGS